MLESFSTNNIINVCLSQIVSFVANALGSFSLLPFVGLYLMVYGKLHASYFWYKNVAQCPLATSKVKVPRRVLSANGPCFSTSIVVMCYTCFRLKTKGNWNSRKAGTGTETGKDSHQSK